MNQIKDGFDALACAIVQGLERLGNNNASTPMGAIEAHGKAILDGSEQMSSTIGSGLESIADAIRYLADTIRETMEKK